MFPDLGLYLVEQGQKEPFELTVFNHLMLGEDRVLGWLINGVTHQYQTSGLEKRPAPIIRRSDDVFYLSGTRVKNSNIEDSRATENRRFGGCGSLR